jgi:hypothetical protein
LEDFALSERFTSAVRVMRVRDASTSTVDADCGAVLCAAERDPANIQAASADAARALSTAMRDMLRPMTMLIRRAQP